MPIDWLRRPPPVSRTFGGGLSGKNVRVSVILDSLVEEMLPLTWFTRTRFKSPSAFVAQSRSRLHWRAEYSSTRSLSMVAKVERDLPVELAENQTARARRWR
jgi:hypothetical protein